MSDVLSASDFSRSSPKLYNMGGPNPRQQSLWAGLDALTLNYQVEWPIWKNERVSDSEHEELKEAAAAIGLELQPMLPNKFDLGAMLTEYHERAQDAGEPIDLPDGLGKIHPGGGKIGGVKYCKFKIERADCVLLIADARKYSGDWPNVKLEISGERCLVYPGGAVEAYRASLGVLQGLGCIIHKESVSRADFCADLPGYSMATFHLAFMRRHWACRANRRHVDQSNGTTLYFGSGPIVLRIYDKLAEMQASALRGSPAKYQHMIVKRWGGVEPETAVRVEFQCRRDWLKLYGVTDMDSLMWHARDLLGYLTGADGTARWFRFLTRRAEKKHTELNETAGYWKKIQSVFMNEFSKPEPLEKIDPNEADIKTLLKQAFGVLECAASNRGFYLPWKTSAAPVKYKFQNYADFEKWIIVMLRSVAVQKPEWDTRRIIEEKQTLPDDPLYVEWLRDWEIKQKGKQ